MLHHRAARFGSSWRRAFGRAFRRVESVFTGNLRQRAKRFVGDHAVVVHHVAFDALDWRHRNIEYSMCALAGRINWHRDFIQTHIGVRVFRRLDLFRHRTSQRASMAAFLHCIYSDYRGDLRLVVRAQRRVVWRLFRQRVDEEVFSRRRGNAARFHTNRQLEVAGTKPRHLLVDTDRIFSQPGRIAAHR